MKILRMPLDDFYRAAESVSKRGFHPETLEMAKAILVDGEQTTVVAERYGKARQQLTLALRKIRAAYANIASTALVRVELELPGELATELAALSQQIAAQKNIEEVNAVTQRLLVDVRAATKKLK